MKKESFTSPVNNLVTSPFIDGGKIFCLGKTYTKDIINRWRSELNIELGNDFKAIDSLAYYKCEATGLRWYEPLSVAGGAELYSQLEKFPWYYESHKWEFEVAIKQLPSSGRVLEIGCGSGRFLKRLKILGYSVKGIELSESARNLAASEGLEVEDETWLHSDLSVDELFDVVCMFQVLEHVPKPRELIELALKRLTTGGLLLVAVPNGQLMDMIDPEHDDLLNQPPHHVSHWDANVFNNLQKYLPLQIMSSSTSLITRQHFTWIVRTYIYSRVKKLPLVIRLLCSNHLLVLILSTLLFPIIQRFVFGHTLFVSMKKC